MGWFIDCKEVSDAHGGIDAKITYKSNAPPIKVGDWITFKAEEEYPGCDWGSPLAVNISLADPPEGSDEEDDEENALPSEGEDGSYPDFQRVFLKPLTRMSEDDRQGMQCMRDELQIEVEGDADCDIPPIVAFDELASALPAYLPSTLRELRIGDSLTAMQAQALPLALGGYDISCISRTTHGKVLTYLLPAATHVEAQAPITPGAVVPVALVLAPTHEKTMSISRLAEKLLRDSQSGKHPNGLTAASLYGTEGDPQVDELQRHLLENAGCHLLAAVPDHLLQLADAGEVSLKRVTYLALDDVDKMIDHGLEESLREVCARVRPDRQALLFAAAWTAEVEQLSREICGDGALVLRGP